jgi:hypothetical protein
MASGIFDQTNREKRDQCALVTIPLRTGEIGEYKEVVLNSLYFRQPDYRKTFYYIAQKL